MGVTEIYRSGAADLARFDIAAARRDDAAGKRDAVMSAGPEGIACTMC